MLTRRDALVLIGAVPAGAAMSVTPRLAEASECPGSHPALAPDRELSLTLSDDLRLQRWSYEGQSYTDARETIALNEGERIRFNFVNDTGVPQSLMLDRRHIHLSAGESFTLDLSIDGLEPRTLRSEHTTRTIRVRPSYQTHATFAG